jgi:hypothetical protein
MALSGTLTVALTVTESTTGEKYELTRRHVISDKEQADKRLVFVPTSVVTIFLVGAAVAAGQYVNPNMIMIVNRDDTNFVTLGFKDTGGDTVYFRLDAGEVFLLGNTKVDTNTTGAVFSAFVDFDTVTAQADTAEVALEYLVISEDAVVS